MADQLAQTTKLAEIARLAGQVQRQADDRARDQALLSAPPAPPVIVVQAPAPKT